MVPADAEPNNENAALGVVWASYSKSVLGTTGVGLFVTQLDPPVADSLHVQHHQTLSVFVHIFSSYAFFFYWPGPFSETCAWGYRAQESLIPAKSEQGHVVSAQDGELGKPV